MRSDLSYYCQKAIGYVIKIVTSDIPAKASSAKIRLRRLLNSLRENDADHVLAFIAEWLNSQKATA